MPTAPGGVGGRSPVALPCRRAGRRSGEPVPGRAPAPGSRSLCPARSLRLCWNRPTSALSPPCCTVIFPILPIFNVFPWTEMLLQKNSVSWKTGTKPGSEPVLSSEEPAITVQNKPKQKKAPKHQEQKQSKNLVPVSLRFFLTVILLTGISTIAGKETSE